MSAVDGNEKELEDDEDGAVASVMGFASFGKIGKAPAPSSAGKKKTAVLDLFRKPASATAVASSAEGSDGLLPTDYMKVFEDSLRLAKERNQQQSRAAVIGPMLPPVSASTEVEAEADQAIVQSTDVKKSKKEKKHKKHKKEKKQKEKDSNVKDHDEQSDDGDLIGPSIPECFKPTSAESSSENSQSAVEKSANNMAHKEAHDEEEEDNEEGDEDEDDDPSGSLFVPRSSQISLDHHTGKPVVALGIDASGSRLVSGGSDFGVRYWNFAGMDAACRPFKTLDQPCGAHQIRYTGFNCTSDCVLVASGSAQLRLYTREGKPLAESLKGYQYISNPRSTPGHTHALLGAAWHPRDGAEFITCAMDNSLRLWDPNNTEVIMSEVRLKSCKEVLVPKSAQGRAVTPTACAYYPDGNLVFCGCTDGSLQAWDRRRRFVNNSHLLHNAHGADTVTCLAFSYDAQCLLSRSMDDTLKLWDVRKFTTPLFVKSGLSTQYEQTACGFAPNDRLFFTATSAPAKLCEKEGRSPGQLLFFDRSAISSASASTSAPVSASAAADALTCSFDAGIIRCVWHAKINQLLLSTSDGRVCVLFDPQRSVNGARLCAAKPAKRSLNSDLLTYKGGFVRESLLTYDDDTMREVRQGKRKSKFHEHESANQACGPRRVHQAEAPLSGPGYGGKLGQKGATLHQYMLQQMVQRRGEDPAEKDIRGAILRHNDEAQKNPIWTGAYAKTQPKPIFQQPEGDQAGASGSDPAEAAKRRRLL